MTDLNARDAAALERYRGAHLAGGKDQDRGKGAVEQD